MTGAPDPKPAKRERRPRRIVDHGAVKRSGLVNRECAACGKPAANSHHVIPRGGPHFGDDVPGNLVGLCGSGTMGCHGAHHGNPYVVHITPDARSMTKFAPFDERRDATWVNRRIGLYLGSHRPDVIEYVLGKLGVGPGTEYLRTRYQMEFL